MAPCGSRCFCSIMLKCYKEFIAFPFQIFSPLSEINHFWNKMHFRWFHVVPGAFGSIMFKCYKELKGFPFQIFSPLSEINYFWNKSAFLDGSMWLPVSLAPLC